MAVENWPVRVPMPQRPPQEAVHTFAEVFRGYAPADAVREARRALALDADWTAAAGACPFGVDVRGLVERLAADDWEGARETVERAHPWPGILGRCCHAFCEGALAAAGRDRSRTPYLSALERAVGDRTQAPAWVEPATRRSERVAVVGAGSAGLGCAYTLRRLGYPVVLFDRLDAAGGKLLTGYPPFRMDKEIVRRESDPVPWGVDWRGGTEVDRAAMEGLLRDFDAVFLGVGAVRSNPLRVERNDLLQGFLQAEAFLEACWLQGSPLPLAGRSVVVVGGGYTAHDVVRTVLRLGGRSRMLYRRGLQDVPLRPQNRERLMARLAAEGVELSWYLAPAAVRPGAAGGTELVCRGTGPQAPAEMAVPCDVLVAATGSTVDLSGLFPPPLRESLTASEDPYAAVEIDPVTRMTSVARLWAGGDVIDSRGNDGAYLDGMVAARSMHAYLRDDLDAWVEANRPLTRRLAGQEA